MFIKAKCDRCKCEVVFDMLDIRIDVKHILCERCKSHIAEEEDEKDAGEFPVQIEDLDPSSIRVDIKKRF